LGSGVDPVTGTAVLATKLRVTVAQSVPAVGCPDQNRASILHAVDRALASGADLLVLPELVNSGYVGTREQALLYGETLPKGPLVEALQDRLRGSELLVALGMCEAGANGVFNSAVLLDGSAVRLHYRKTHLWAREASIFDRGDLGFPVADTRLGRVGMLICFDLWFPEACRLLALQGVEVVCVPSNWDLVPGRYYDDDLRTSIAASQAHMNEMIIVCADRAGGEEGAAFCGRSVVCDPRGVLAGPAANDAEDWLDVEVDIGHVRDLRASRLDGHLTSRREDLYTLSSVDGPEE